MKKPIKIKRLSDGVIFNLSSDGLYRIDGALVYGHPLKAFDLNSFSFIYSDGSTEGPTKIETLTLWEILVPTILNNKPIKTRYHRVWDAKVRNIANGLTILKPAKGTWVSDSGELFEERMIPVRIACNENQIIQIMDMTAKYYKQEAIMAYKISENALIRHYKKD